MKRIALILLSLLAFSPLADAQLIEPIKPINPPGGFPFPGFFPRIYVPYVEADTAGFAYLQESGTEQSLHLARLTQAFLLPTAERVATLATEDILTDTILDLHASPDNRWLAVYTFQDTGFGFVDHNLTFFDMRDGTSLGLRNEHSFSSLKESVYPSARLAEFKHAMHTDFGVPLEELSGLDYAVVVEGANVQPPDYGWNADGSFWLSFELDVDAVYEDGYREFIGTETFRMNIGLAATGVSTLSFGDTRTPATFPSVFRLTPEDRPEAIIQFESRDVRFHYSYFSYSHGRYVRYFDYEAAIMTEGNIPRRYRSLR